MNPTIVTPHGLAIKPRFEGRDAAVIDLRGQLAFLCDNWRYILHDYRLVDGRRTRLLLEDPDATHRAFAMADGSRWVYVFALEDSRALGADELLRQISAAVYKPRRPNEGTVAQPYRA